MDFLVGSSIPAAHLERLEKILGEEPAIESIVSLRAVYSGPEEVIVAAKVRPSTRVDTAGLTRAMDDLDHRIRAALPYVADVFIDVTAHRSAEPSREQARD